MTTRLPANAAPTLVAGIETGGTKVLCAVANAATPTTLLHTCRIPTADPATTTAAINAFLNDIDETTPIAAIGVASFGPVNIDPTLPRWGWVTGTPKLGWANTDLLSLLDLTQRHPTVVMSDVSSAAFAESIHGAGTTAQRIAYATIGTGVGVGVTLNEQPLLGNGYPELGHLLVRRHPDDTFPGSCPFHGDCLEGLAAGPAIISRWGSDLSSLPDASRTAATAVIAYYIAQLVAATGYAVGIERFILSGGVMKTTGLLEAVRMELPNITGGPGAGHAESLDAVDFIVPPTLGDHAGVVGAITAARALLT